MSWDGYRLLFAFLIVFMIKFIWLLVFLLLILAKVFSASHLFRLLFKINKLYISVYPESRWKNSTSITIKDLTIISTSLSAAVLQLNLLTWVLVIMVTLLIPHPWVLSKIAAKVHLFITKPCRMSLMIYYSVGGGTVTRHLFHTRYQ